MKGYAVMRVASLFKIVTAALMLSGCQTAAEHAANVRSAEVQGDRLTVGKVQREIREGMSGAEVVQILGSPNIVSTDENRREVWVYDKISTERIYSTSSGGVNVLVLGGALIGGGLVGGVPSAGYGSSAGVQSTSQRTLTIIIKFDAEKKVRDFAYHSSQF